MNNNNLAIMGGQPVRNEYLPYGQQWLDDHDIQAVIETLKSPYLTQGPKIAEFEEKVANYVGANYAVAFCNGTAGLHAACYAAGVSEGDEVITTPITFVASANCVRYLGANPVFVDINNSTYNIDPEKIEDKITSKTKAIIPVDFTGQPADIKRIKEIADKYKLVVIQDAAHSLGATYDHEYLNMEEGNSCKVGAIADMTMFSFHPVKHITTGEGGMIVTNSEVYAKKLRSFRSHGITSDRSIMLEDHGPWYYEMLELGYNYRMTDIQASLGISQLNKLDAYIKIRRNYANIYNQAFQGLSGIIIPYQLNGTHSSWHLYSLRFELQKFTANRRQIFDALRAENIGVHVHYIPVHLQPYYRERGYGKGLCPIAEQWYEEIITLPLFPKMTMGDIESVIEAVNKVYYAYKK
ncbi:UDP-4-amino-4,6-dideoxy-N-acetyl-beta-L-altrosamine transaminase [Desulfuribacillus stibiiarsenatis]|uniref:UDP-4-amino-4, 6-dideoxy-N-acetyl-beta-L-altrosamine transaminase n=1 Tax=Desulfuribacillus stibiiarsenatis TaxID=1390249 RepID=A0A1E5L9B9_9FIRM|nr:UDP-4-amino-4,6-dideoxy-N-acetyl-beta-L-altrosamine transaminase [Desulfuribacillus stibiiarsenatis]OEH86757.1 UDP-4-amino-4,6-dideoxy-N-acetyl-beta-L-altrosamine transaminase [Desulfuribacillus stibiiarsenatis]